MRNQPRILFLIGPRGSGKTTIGRLVAERLGLPFFDTDDMVMGEAGCSIADIVRHEGWESFRMRESRSLAAAVAHSAEDGGVVSTGGGMVLAQENRERMRASGTVFYLAAPADCLYPRLERQHDVSRRPSLTDESPLAELTRVLAEREPLYRETAHHRLDASAPRGSLVKGILSLLGKTPKEFS